MKKHIIIYLWALEYVVPSILKLNKTYLEKINFFTFCTSFYISDHCAPLPWKKVYGRLWIQISFQGFDDPNNAHCSDQNDIDEDYIMGQCMQSLNIEPGDTTDHLRRQRFFARNPIEVVKPRNGIVWSWWSQLKYPAEEGDNCCSNTTISFHYISADEMYVIDFFLYKMKVFG